MAEIRNNCDQESRARKYDNINREFIHQMKENERIQKRISKLVQDQEESRQRSGELRKQLDRQHEDRDLALRNNSIRALTIAIACCKNIDQAKAQDNEYNQEGDHEDKGTQERMLYSNTQRRLMEEFNTGERIMKEQATLWKDLITSREKQLNLRSQLEKLRQVADSAAASHIAEELQGVKGARTLHQSVRIDTDQHQQSSDNESDDAVKASLGRRHLSRQGQVAANNERGVRSFLSVGSDTEQQSSDEESESNAVKASFGLPHLSRQRQVAANNKRGAVKASFGRPYSSRQRQVAANNKRGVRSFSRVGSDTEQQSSDEESRSNAVKVSFGRPHLSRQEQVAANNQRGLRTLHTNAQAAKKRYTPYTPSPEGK